MPQYMELAPCPDLAPWVECCWSIRATDAPSLPNRVLPDGCADLIVGVPGEPGPVVVGPMQTATIVPLAGQVDLFGVRLRPGCALPFLDVPLDELTDRTIRLDLLWTDSAEAFAPAAPGRLVERVAALERVLCRRLRTWTRRGDDAVAARAVSLMRHTRGSIGVRQAAAALGVGERRLERLFDRFVGLSPKVLARVLRFRHAVRQVQGGESGRAPAAWAELAFGAGYADQSHLIREFKALAGVTPAQYAAERRRVGFVQYEVDPSA